MLKILFLIMFGLLFQQWCRSMTRYTLEHFFETIWLHDAWMWKMFSSQWWNVVCTFDSHLMCAQHSFLLSCGDSLFLAKLQRLFNFDAQPASVSQKIYCFWRIRHAPLTFFKSLSNIGFLAPLISAEAVSSILTSITTLKDMSNANLELRGK